MARYIYCPRPDVGVKALSAGLGAILLTSFDGMRFRKNKKAVDLVSGDSLVCWGSLLPPLDGVKMLNSSEDPMNDLNALADIRNEGNYRAIKINRPKDFPSGKSKDGKLIPRVVGHKGGEDILSPSGRIDYWTTYYIFSTQIRCHSFLGRFVRCGTRVPKEGYKVCPEAEWKPGSNLAHPWVKSEAGGWDLDYNDPKPSATVRSMATGVIKSLGLDFGTVDIGYDNDSYYVIGVNFAPDLPNEKAVEGYAMRLGKWFDGAKDDTAKG